jgi:hypothetical protein
LIASRTASLGSNATPRPASADRWIAAFADRHVDRAIGEQLPDPRPVPHLERELKGRALGPDASELRHEHVIGRRSGRSDLDWCFHGIVGEADRCDRLVDQAEEQARVALHGAPCLGELDPAPHARDETRRRRSSPAPPGWLTPRAG